MEEQPKPTSPTVLCHPCPIDELEAALQSVPEDEVRKYISRLHHQLSIAERVVAQRFERPRHRKEVDRARFAAELKAMTIAELQSYIANKKPYFWVARRVLSIRLSAATRKSRGSSRPATGPTPTVGEGKLPEVERKQGDGGTPPSGGRFDG